MAITPRPHQLAALKDIKKGLKKHDRAQAILACGTGKSLLAAWAAVQQSKAKKIVVLLPSLALIRQLLRTWRSVSLWKSWEAVAVCSDKTVGEDAVHVKTAEVGCPVTTDSAVVTAFLKGRGVRVVFSTYQSAALLIGNKFDLGIFDEAHKTAGSKEKQFAFALSNKNLRINKRLFLTATPRVWRGRDEDVEYASMDDEEVYGPRVHELSFRRAVDLKLIRNYKIVVTGILEDVNTDHYLALQVAVQKAMDQVGAKQVFSYHRSVAEAVQFSTDTQGVFGADVSLFHVNGNQTTAERDVTLAAFAKAPRAIVSNARCLSEGVDVPVTDMVVFAQAKRSVIDIVQSAGRAMRLSDGKEHGYIFVPIWHRKDEAPDAAIKRQGFSPIRSVLNALSLQDSVLEAELTKKRAVSAERGEEHDSENSAFIFLGDPVEIPALKKAITVALYDQKLLPNTWTVERCFRVAETLGEYEAIRTDFSLRSAAVRLGCWEAIRKKYQVRKLPQRLWPLEDCAKEAAKYSSRTDFAKGSYEVYQGSRARGFLDQIMPQNKNEERLWTFERCKVAARGCSSVQDLRRKNAAAASSIMRNHWRLLIFPKAPVYAAKKSLADHIALARTASSVRALKQKYPSTYKALSRVKGQIYSLFPSERKPPGYWNDWANFSREAKKYASRHALELGCGAAYAAGRKNGFLDRFFLRKDTA